MPRRGVETINSLYPAWREGKLSECTCCYNSGDRMERSKLPEAEMDRLTVVFMHKRLTYWGWTAARSGIASIASGVTGGQYCEVCGSWCDVQKLPQDSDAMLATMISYLSYGNKIEISTLDPNQIMFSMKTVNVLGFQCSKNCDAPLTSTPNCSSSINFGNASPLNLDIFLQA